MNQVRYGEVRPFIRLGDIIAFEGKGGVSDIIGRWTYWPWYKGPRVSHVAAVFEVTPMTADGRRVELIESTTLNNDEGKAIHGVQFTRLSHRIATYNGRVFWYPLTAEAYLSLDPERFTRYCKEQDGKKYDWLQAVLSAVPFLPQRENYERLFCSELAAGALQAGGVLPDSVNASTLTPAELLKAAVFKSPVELLS